MPVGMRSVAKNPRQLNQIFPAKGGNIYFRPGLGKSVLLTEVFLAKDRVPVGTRCAAKKTEVSKTDFVSPRVEMYLPYAVAGSSTF